jgi:hypothetical protein
MSASRGCDALLNTALPPAELSGEEGRRSHSGRR